MPSIEENSNTLSAEIHDYYSLLLTSCYQNFERFIIAQPNLLQEESFIRALFESEHISDPIEKIWFVAHNYPAIFSKIPSLFFLQYGEPSNTFLHKIILHLEEYCYVPVVQITRILETIVQHHEGETEYPFVGFLNQVNHEGVSAAQILSRMIASRSQVSPRTEEKVFAHFLERITAKSFMQANPTLPPQVTEDFIASNLEHCRKVSKRRLEHGITVEDGEETFYMNLRASVFADVRGDAWTASLQQLLNTFLDFGAVLPVNNGETFR